jgi:hypothetical protein
MSIEQTTQVKVGENALFELLLDAGYPIPVYATLDWDAQSRSVVFSWSTALRSTLAVFVPPPAEAQEPAEAPAEAQEPEPAPEAPAAVEKLGRKRQNYTQMYYRQKGLPRPDKSAMHVVYEQLITGPCTPEDLRRELEKAGWNPTSASPSMSALVRMGVASREGLRENTIYRLVREPTKPELLKIMAHRRAILMMTNGEIITQ